VLESSNGPEVRQRRGWRLGRRSVVDGKERASFARPAATSGSAPAPGRVVAARLWPMFGCTLTPTMRTLSALLPLSSFVLSEPSVVSTPLKKLQDTAVVTESCALLARKRRCLPATRRRPRLSTERARKPSALAFALPPRILYALRALACVGPCYASSTSTLSA
jgi:hypothetical protein